MLQPAGTGALGWRNVVLPAVTSRDVLSHVSAQVPRFSVLFGPRRGVTREVRQRVLVGRGAHCDLQLIDEKVSREHCAFENRDGQVEVVDLGSRNGTWVNGERVTRRVLQPNDAVGIGETLVVFSPDVEALLARDGDSTLITSAAALSNPTEAAEPQEAAFARAGRLMLEAGLSASPDEAASRLARAALEALGCDDAFVVSRSAEGVWRPWVAVPAGAVLSVNTSLAELALKQRRTLAVEASQSRAMRDEHTTRVLRTPAFVLCAPMNFGGVLFASRASPFDSQELALASVLASAAAPSLQPVKSVAVAQPESVVAESASMREAVRVVKQVAPSASTVLLTGESGSGKEVLARLVHRESRRASGPFVAINCGALPRELAESELFGHERGAFTGAAAQHAGVFERADGGTLFLDEIGELPLELQVKLLRVLEERLVWRLGARAPTSVDVRLVCATNRELEKEIANARFREDLFWRINVVRVALEPLRSRQEDVVPLARTMLARHGRHALSAEAERALVAYSWPGNVRQLANAIERAVVLKVDDSPVSLADLPPEVVAGSTPRGRSGTLAERIAALEKEQIVLALQRARGVKAQACELLGISRPTLDRKLQEYGVEVP
ncbi:MAG: AAA family ATPase [Archangium gephyra]|uniref:AAA family ATPase n=1 Tax=Archangium gephyra TaxID=48 RepID=A0A2W5TVS1_9BACT|nr:MAG: AAA family ATPase [Archangium gephyra]